MRALAKHLNIPLEKKQIQVEQTKKQEEGIGLSEIRYVHITIYDIPAELVKEFSEKVVKPFYPS